MANTVNGGSHSSTESLNGGCKHTKPHFRECVFHRVKIIFITYGAYVVLFFLILAGSWVKLDGSFRNGNGAQHSPVISEDGAMEDLLAEAVEEQSKQGSRYKALGWDVRTLIAVSRKVNLKPICFRLI